MSLDQNAIRKAYSNAVTIDDDTGVFDASGNSITIDQTLVDAARVELDKLNYRTDRTINGSTTYDSFGNQLDMLYADMLAGKLDTTGTWATHIKAVKDANPKPS
tara:strand:- start:850 stop:1161 length:312 start_codon:yes stop_codon:yes gene_type:complete